jgi:preprotein translocase subunit SecF
MKRGILYRTLLIAGLLAFSLVALAPAIPRGRSVVAALLTVIGFSVNDTVVLFDRIRENQRKMRRQSLEAIANKSINETLSRTIITNGAAVFTVVALFLFGGSVIHTLAFVLLVGFVVGRYSSIFVATPVVFMFREPAR